MKLQTMTTSGWNSGLRYHLWIDGTYTEATEMAWAAMAYIKSLGHRCDGPAAAMIRSQAIDQNGLRYGPALFRAKIYCSSPDPLMMIKLAGRVPD